MKKNWIYGGITLAILTLLVVVIVEWKSSSKNEIVVTPDTSKPVETPVKETRRTIMSLMSTGD
jgi:hypothetical protein